jgi:uncharacterized delta-60 repeat protein
MKFLHFFLLPIFLIGSLSGFAQVGSLDQDFSDDGFIHTGVGLPYSYGVSGALQPDGKILFGGPVWGDKRNDFGLGRLLPNGSFDSTFSGDGRLFLDLGDHRLDQLLSLDIRPDGRIVTFGLSEVINPHAYVFGLVQFRGDGTVDSTFGNNGVVKTRFTNFNVPTGMKVQPDGKMLTIGYAQTANTDIGILARYLADGQLDTTFNNDGIIYENLIGFDVRVHELDIQPDGKIVTAGLTQFQVDVDYVMYRYLPDGSTDSTFGVNGFVKAEFIDGYNSEIYDLTILPDGKILIVGHVIYPNVELLARFNQDGSPDTSFGANGVLTLPISDQISNVNALHVLPDGSILLTGEVISTMTESYIYLARLLENGMLDSSFGIDGLQLTNILPPGEDTQESANVILLQPDGKIILIGSAGQRFVITRHLTELNVGLLDFSTPAVAPLIYPNPIQETATLQYELSESMAISIELYDLQGKRVLTLLPQTQQPAGKHELPVVLPSHLASGAYVLSVSNAKGRAAVQVIKQ